MKKSKRNKKYLETSKNRNITSPNLWFCSGEKTICLVNIEKTGQLLAKEWSWNTFLYTNTKSKWIRLKCKYWNCILPEEILGNILFDISLGNTFVSTGKSSKAKINGTASKINLKRYIHLWVHCSIIYNSQDMNATSMTSTDKWIKKMWYVCICVCVCVCVYIYMNISQP